jgi:hypothetical protein
LLEASLERVPTNPKARVELGRLDRAAGRERDALDHFRAAWSMPGAYPPALLMLAQLELAADDASIRAPAEGVRRLRGWLASAPAGDPLRAELTVLLATGLIDHPTLAESPGEAGALIDDVLRENPEHPRALQVRAHLDGR